MTVLLVVVVDGEDTFKENIQYMQMGNNETAIRTVFVIYTGGTIGMLLGEHGQLA
jgi:L-asparaginase/Glu-tRNA(Gln) amidotransferase subunit D